jgi:hypothetical protein
MDFTLYWFMFPVSICIAAYAMLVFILAVGLLFLGSAS